MAKSLNRVQLIGNLTRDPEMRYTPQGTGVCSFSVATNRSWKTENGDTKDEVEYHRIVAWDKLGEICSQMLSKGKKVFVEGRIQTRKWTGQDGVAKSITEIIISDMILLERGAREEGVQQAPGEEIDIPDDFAMEAPSKPAASAKKAKEEVSNEPAADDDIPF